MLFGDPSRFAIEALARGTDFVSIRLWVGDVAFGDLDQVSVLGALQLDALAFLDAATPELADVPFAASSREVREWWNRQVQTEHETAQGAKRADHLIRSVQPFAFAPEGLSTVRVIVLPHGAKARVTAWDTSAPESNPVRADVAVLDVRTPLERFAAWRP